MSDSKSDEVLITVEDGVMLFTINRPESMNSMSAAVSSGLLEAVERANTEDDVRVLVLTGTGRAFCAGAEITANSDPTKGSDAVPPRHRRMDRLSGSGRTAMAFRDCEVPVLAAINGAAAGAGFGLALCADVRFASESARIGPIFIKRGLSTDYGASYWLPRIVGAARAFEIIYSGDLLDAQSALAAGLVNRVYPDDRLLDEALAFARTIASGPPMAYTAVRRLLQESLADGGSPEFLEREWWYQSSLLRTEDAREGFQAFRDQRPPTFRGL